MHKFLLLVIALVINTGASATIYKCVGQDGAINFTDSPCHSSSAETVVQASPEAKTTMGEDSFGVAIDRAAAGRACEDAAKSKASIPSSVDFSRFWDASFQAYPGGRAAYLSAFTASNAFGVEQKFDIACHFKGLQLDAANVTPAR